MSDAPRRCAACGATLSERRHVCPKSDQGAPLGVLKKAVPLQPRRYPGEEPLRK